MLKRHPRYKKGIQSNHKVPSYRDKMNSIKAENAYNMLMSLRAEKGAEESKVAEMPRPPPINTNKPSTLPPRTSIPKFKRKRVRKSFAGTGKDITTHKENKTEYQLKIEEEKDELDEVDEKELQEAMKPLRSGEALYNKLVKKKKKKALPKSVRTRIKKMNEIKQANPEPPKNVMDAIYDM